MLKWSKVEGVEAFTAHDRWLLNRKVQFNTKIESALYVWHCVRIVLSVSESAFCNTDARSISTKEKRKASTPTNKLLCDFSLLTCIYYIFQ